MSGAPLVAGELGPQPGEIYREFARHNGGNRDWRVTDDEAVKRFPRRAAEFLPNPRLEIVVEDLEHAVRAEALLDRWGGHRGTINKRIRFNDQAWIRIPELTSVPAPLRPEMLMFQDNPIVEVPLDHLTEGINVFEADCDEADGFGWGQWGLYSLILRVYYEPEKKGPELAFAAEISSPASGSELTDDPAIEVAATSQDGIARVDLLAAYNGYDEDGDGHFGGFHESYFQAVRGEAAILRDHVGTRWRKPYVFHWNTHWVPDQAPRSISLIARVQDARGYWAVTQPVSELTLRRSDHSVRLYRASGVPEDFGVRVDQTATCQITIPATHPLAAATEAALHLRTWHGSDADHSPIRVNDHPLSIHGKNHHYDYDLLSLPPKALQPGENQFTIHSETEHHQLEILWPGPALVVRYDRALPSPRQAAEAASSGTDAATAKLGRYARAALTKPGDPQRGQLLFQDQQRTKCATCHQVNDRGGQVGPDLSKIGGKFDRPHLVESLLEPSRQIVEGFRTTVLVLADGRTLSGVERESDDRSVRLLDAEAREHVIPRDQIDESQTLAVSLMPSGIADAISAAEFTDLVAYLETLRSGNTKFGAGVSGPVSLPPGFEIDTVATGLSGATALEVLPDGRVLICEQPGRLRVVKEGRLLDEPMLSIEVENYWERGLIGVTVPPEFPREPFVYVCYVAGDPYPHHRISRFRVDGDQADRRSEQVLLRGDDQRELGGHVPAGHQGGGMHFGHDGKLYVGIGEQTAETPAQRLDTFQGKILRLNRDGSIPKDNPFVAETAGKYRAIWARGCRNPFTFAVHPDTGELFLNDVGGKFEEINIGQAGANYGWPIADHGPTEDKRFVGPIHVYPQASISGGDFVPDGLDWPARLADRYYFADFVHGWIKTIDPASPAESMLFASGLRRPVDLRFSRDAGLYLLLRNAWVVDGKFEGGTGSLLRIRSVELPRTSHSESGGREE